ncbi:MAG TPA: sugar ABC transporter permease [Armatimonadota bacterium]|jgi:multiple sugar transport system permease protein
MKTRALTKREKRTLWIALAMLAPNFLGFMVFTAGPVVFSLIMAFTNWDLTIHNHYSTEVVKFIGFENFITLFRDEWRNFSFDFANTLYLMVGIPVSIALSLGAALLLEKPVGGVLAKRGGGRFILLTVVVTVLAAVSMALLGVTAIGICMVVITGVMLICGQIFGQTAFRTIFYLPNLTAGVAVYILWKALYRPEGGPINRLVQPVLDTTVSAVHASPSWLWQGGGWLLIIGALVLFAWFLVDGINKLRYRDITIVGLVFGAIGVAVVAFCVGWVGMVISHLPATVAAAGDAGLLAPKWLADPDWSKPALIIMGVFMAVGSNNMLMYLAALSNVPVSLTEAASIDGANKWQTFWNVTWPQLAPTTFFIVIMSTIGGLQGGFDTARVMTEGGPANSTTTLSYYLYNQGFTDFKLGLASAIAWSLFLIIFLVTLINWKFGNQMVND